MLSMLGVPTPIKQRKVKVNYHISIPSNTDKAKEVPIETLYNGNLKPGEKIRMGLCPFHEETTPSFAIYPQTNSWYCFAGCGGGDVITFYMKLHGVDFKTAVEELEKK